MLAAAHLLTALPLCMPALALGTERAPLQKKTRADGGDEHGSGADRYRRWPSPSKYSTAALLAAVFSCVARPTDGLPA
jgi:hypothetical protein